VRPSNSAWKPLYNVGNNLTVPKMTTAHLEAEILKLPRSIRARLAEILISSLDEDTEIEKAWIEEADRRYQSYLNGDEKVILVENAISEIRKELCL